jgi:TusA-related sulfurtransferase
LEVHATDPGSVKEFKAFCATTGDQLMAAGETAGGYILCAEHDRQLGGVSPLPSLMAAKG